MRSFSLAILAAGLSLATAAAGELPGAWAYKSVTKPTPPVPQANNTVRTPIDAFVAVKLEAHGSSFAAPADKRTLIRRATFDLVGLPPTEEQVRAFLDDQSPQAFEKVVDRLLASPQYGERQALFWLDLARFAESDGFRADGARPNAWRYRDYVIRSFNNDKPYDRFILEQLAGDELFPTDFDSQIATGFLRHFPDEHNAVNLEQRRQEILNDITDTTASAFLGITFGCAKCHDHKNDPVTQVDYYRFQAFFAGFWPIDALQLSKTERAQYEEKLTEWQTKTAELRAEIARIEAPYRQKESQRQRTRFPAEYARVLDVPVAKRTPLEKQIGAMIEKQVYPKADVSKQLNAAEKARWQELTAKLAVSGRPPQPATAMAMTELPEPPLTRLLKRGDWRHPAEELKPGFIATIDGREPTITPTLVGTSGRRTALARWIADSKNPLTARVLVNRLWQQHFGRGIVTSASDFGVAGDRPTHPELLDWLANEFTRNGWSIKKMHRLIVTSAVYRQSAGNAEDSSDNALLGHFPRRRLDGEAIRDSMLAVSGLLNLKAGGPSIYPELPAEIKPNDWNLTADAAERQRRSIYVAVKRNLRYPLFSLFDSPERAETCARRFITTTAPQALMLLNDAMVLEFARQFAARVQQQAETNPDRVIERAFTIGIGRPPTSEERETMTKFLGKHPGPFKEAVVDLCHSLLNLNEFLYID